VAARAVASSTPGRAFGLNIVAHNTADTQTLSPGHEAIDRLGLFICRAAVGCLASFALVMSLSQTSTSDFGFLKHARHISAGWPSPTWPARRWPRQFRTNSGSLANRAQYVGFLCGQCYSFQSTSKLRPHRLRSIGLTSWIYDAWGRYPMCRQSNLSIVGRRSRGSLPRLHLNLIFFASMILHDGRRYGRRRSAAGKAPIHHLADLKFRAP
jgi:hypothetical protein